MVGLVWLEGNSSLCSASTSPWNKRQQSVKSKIWINQVQESSNWIQNVWNGVKSCFVSGCTQCSATSHKTALSWAEGSKQQAGLLRWQRWVPGLHCDIPCLTESTWSPQAAELSLNSSPAPLQPVQKFKPQRYIIICDFTDTHLSGYRSWCPASPPCTLPAPNAPAKLLWRLLYLLDSLATSKGVYNLSLQRS